MHLHRKVFTKYFVVQSSHKVFASATLHYKACTSTSQYFFVLQSLLKALPVYTTLHYKACTKYFPVLLCTTELAQSTSQYYFVLQSLRVARPSTTVYCKACTKQVPVLPYTTKLHNTTVPCATKLAQSTSQYWFVQTLQCVFQHHVGHPRLSTHIAT